MREHVIAAEAQRQRLRRDVQLAWLMAAYTRQKKLPALQSTLAKVGGPGEAAPSRRQTPAQQRSVLEILSQQYGIPLRVRRPAPAPA